MKFESFVARRYLRAKRKQAFIGVISLITLVGITLGVAALNLSLAVHNGMRAAFLESLVGHTGQLFITDSSWNRDGFSRAELDQIVSVLETVDTIQAISFQRQEYCVLSSTRHISAPGRVKGVIPEDDLSVSSPLTKIFRGSTQGMNPADPKARPGIVLGVDLAAKLGVDLGDTVRMTLPQLSSPSLIMGQSHLKQRTFDVVGLFRTGSSELDAFESYVHLTELLKVLNSDRVHAVMIKLFDLHALDATKERLQADTRLPSQCRIMDLRDLNQNLLHALTIEKWGTTLIIGLIILIAALNMVSALIMLVMEKNRDIGIMKSMGAHRNMILGIFIRQGMTLSFWGTLLGTVLGVGLAMWADATQLLKLDSEVYEVLNYLPFTVKWLEVASVAFGSLFISFLSALYPAFQGASLNPVEALRYE